MLFEYLFYYAFNLWFGGIELTRFSLIVSLVIILPVQLLLCFKVKHRILRLLPVILFSALIVNFLAIALIVKGWEGLLFAILASFNGVLLFTCGIGWSIWRHVNRRRQDKD